MKAFGPFHALLNERGELLEENGLAIYSEVGPHFQSNAQADGRKPIRVLIVELPEEPAS